MSFICEMLLQIEGTLYRLFEHLEQNAKVAAFTYFLVNFYSVQRKWEKDEKKEKWPQKVNCLQVNDPVYNCKSS